MRSVVVVRQRAVPERSAWMIGGAVNLVGSVVSPLGAAFLVTTAVASLREPVAVLASGLATSTLGAGGEPTTAGKEGIGARERFLAVRLWLGVPPSARRYLLAEPQLSRSVDALFESMSGFSTTGAAR
jgi:hypothetical protein